MDFGRIVLVCPNTMMVLIITGCTQHNEGNEKVYSYDEAVTELNVMSLTKRISELRRDGIGIKTEWRTSTNGAKYGVYSLAE